MSVVADHCPVPGSKTRELAIAATLLEGVPPTTSTRPSSSTALPGPQTL
jgi:hypothetical protein